MKYPNTYKINSAIELVGLQGYIPYDFIFKCIELSRSKLLGIDFIPKTAIEKSLYELILDTDISMEIEDSIRFVKRLGELYDLRIIDDAIKNSASFDLTEVPNSFNYSFVVKDIDANTRVLLGITDDQFNEIEELEPEVVSILMLATGYGSCIKTAKTTSVSQERMSSYGHIARIQKHHMVLPWFEYKFSIKDFNVNVDSVEDVKSDNLVVGFFLDSFSKSTVIKSIFKLLGSIVLQHDDIKRVTVYSFYGDSYNKKVIETKKELIEYFHQIPQLKLFPISNSKAIQAMLHENQGDDIVFIPNIKADCSIPPSYYGKSRINILSFNESKFNLKYSYICKKSGGIFLSI